MKKKLEDIKKAFDIAKEQIGDCDSYDIWQNDDQKFVFRFDDIYYLSDSMEEAREKLKQVLKESRCCD